MSGTVQQREVAPGAVVKCLERAAAALLELRREDGRWLASVDAGVGPAIDYLLLDNWLRRRGSALGQTEDLPGSILARQNADGGFSAFTGGPFDLDTTVRAYVALRLSGVGRDEPEMTRCLAAIHSGGGLEKTGVLTRLDLNFAGLYPGEACLSVPAEIMFFQPRWLEPLAAWARAAAVPLSVIRTLSPEQESPPDFSGRELTVTGTWPPAAGGGWLRRLDRYTPLPLRQMALRRAEKWLVERINRADALQEAFPAIRYTVMALELLGHSNESAVRRWVDDCLARLVVDGWVQPYAAPVRDTALALRSLHEAATAPPPLGDDWLRRPSRVEETAKVLFALEPGGGAPESEFQALTATLLAQQSEDGGWASFEHSRSRPGALKLAGVEPRSLTDGTSPGTTGLVLEALCLHGVDGADPAVRRGVEYLVRNQDLDGSWTGQWPGGCIGATSFAVAGLSAAGEDPHEAHVLRAGEWLRSVQNADGGWGEDPSGFQREEYAPGESTAVHTAWAVIGLIASGDPDSDSVRRGAAYLVETQTGDGDWPVRGQTGSWQAGALPTQAGLDCLCYPILALSHYRNVQRQLGRNTV